MTRFLCVGDLHLEAGGDYGREPGERLREQEAVWARALEIGRELDADAVLFAGDAFHKARPTPEAMLAFQRALLDHDANAIHGREVFAILGNHDVASAAAGTGLEVFAEGGLIVLAKGATVIRRDDVSLAFLPWGSAGRLVAAAGGGDRDEINRQAADALLDVARGLRAQITGPAVLVTHFSISGAVTPDGADVGLFREPVLDAHALDAIGFDAVVAGHIHKPQAIDVLAADDPRPHRPMFYVGSPMPLNFGEAKSDHGVWILDVDPSPTHDTHVETAFVPIESRRFVTLELDLEKDPAEGPPPAWEEADLDGAIVKVKIRGRADHVRALDVGGLKRAILANGAHKVWAVQTDVIREDRARVEGLDETLGELEALDLYLAARGINGTRGARLRELTEKYLEESRA